MGYKMAWDEPGGNKHDPWSGNGHKGPPDLEEVLKKFYRRFSKAFIKNNSNNNSPNGNSSSFGLTSIILIFSIISLIFWIFASIYIVDEGKRGVVLRLGKYLETTMPGPHLRIFPIDQVEIVNIEQRRFREIGYRSGNRQQSIMHSVPKEALMLTQDENIVDVHLAVQYQVSDPRAYLFNVFDAENVLVQVVESAARETIGKNTMNFVLTEGRSNIATDIKLLSQQILDSYIPDKSGLKDSSQQSKGTGLQIITVVLQDVQPPEEVQEAFADTIKAREDEQRLKNEAEAYSNEVIPRARGQAARRLQEAAAYKEQVIAQAQGEANRFDRLLDAYQKAPGVTRERLYLETLEDVMSHASKVIVDMPQNANSIFFIPPERLLKPGGGELLGASPSVSMHGGNTATDSSTITTSSPENNTTTVARARSNRTREIH